MTTTHQSPKRSTYWHGSSVVRSSGNAFTRSGPSLFATPQEAVKAAKLAQTEKVRKDAQRTCEAFGNHQLQIAQPRRAKKAA
jgi:hypothetical protein